MRSGFTLCGDNGQAQTTHMHTDSHNNMKIAQGKKTDDVEWSVRGGKNTVVQTDGGTDAVSDEWAPETQRQGQSPELPAASYSGLCSL